MDKQVKGKSRIERAAFGRFDQVPLTPHHERIRFGETATAGS